MQDHFLQEAGREPFQTQRSQTGGQQMQSEKVIQHSNLIEWAINEKPCAKDLDIACFK